MIALRRFALACALLAFSGCGFLDTDGVDGTPLGDGLSPYGAAEPIELCVDGARVMDTTRPPGLCHAEGHEAAACERDDECTLPESCVCGRCVVKLCEFSTECAEGTVCSGSPRRCQLRCEADEECGHLGVCENGTCVRACAAQTQCGVGELCLAARCRAIACGPTGPNCGPAEVCTHQFLSAEVSGPSVVPAGDGLALYAAVLTDGASERVLYRFVSRDGLAFFAEPSAPILTASASGVDLAQPSALATDEGFLLFYEVDGGAAIDLAIDPSGEGLSFESTRVGLTPSSAWENGRVGAPSAAWVEGQIVLLYEGGDGEGIGLTASADGAFTNAASPVIVPGDLEDPARFSDVTEVRAPFAYVSRAESGRRVLRIYLGAQGIARPASPGGTFDQSNLSIAAVGAYLDGPVESLDFTPHPANPVLGRVQNFRPQDESAPSLVHFAGKYWLYVDTPEGIYVARNPAD